MEKYKCEYVADIFFHVIFMSIIHLFHLIITILVMFDNYRVKFFEINGLHI